MRRTLTAKQKKKLAISVLCAVTFGLLSGCGNAQNNAVGSEVQQQHKQVVEYFNNYDKEESAFSDCVGKYADAMTYVQNYGVSGLSKLTAVVNQMNSIINKIKNLNVPPESDIEKFEMDAVTAMQSEQESSSTFADMVNNNDFTNMSTMIQETKVYSDSIIKLGDEEDHLKTKYNYFN